MDSVCAASLCLVAGLVLLFALLGSAAAETPSSSRPCPPGKRGFDPFELQRQDGEPDEDDERSAVYYHRGWMELGYRDRRDDGPFTRR